MLVKGLNANDVRKATGEKKGERTGWGGPEIWTSALDRGLPPADPEDAPGKQVDLVSASVVPKGRPERS